MIKAHPGSCDVLLCDGYDDSFNVPDSLASEDFYRAATAHCDRAA